MPFTAGRSRLASSFTKASPAREQARDHHSLVGKTSNMNTSTDLNNFLSNAGRSALVFRAINNKSRQRILSYLLENPSSSVTTIFVTLRREQCVVSSHLAVLRKAGIVTANRQGKNVFYSVHFLRLQRIEKVMGVLLDEL